MPNNALLSSSVQAFIAENHSADPAEIALKGSPFPNVSIKDLLQQLQGKRKAQKKLPLWFSTNGILYPPPLNLSQTSSQATAQYKASLISGGSLIDITGGFGVDDYFFAQNIETIVHCEQNANLSKLAKHNHTQLPKTHPIHFFEGDGLQFLKTRKGKADWIYADPGRRSISGTRVFRLEDSEPNILKHLPLLLEKAHKVLLKTAPFLDLKLGISQLKTVEKIIVVSLKNDVKELLWILGSTAETNPTVTAINLQHKLPQIFTGSLAEENHCQVKLGEPSAFLYEPNPAILKAGFFNLITERFPVQKLAPNSHLYTASEAIDFPGRRFEIIEILGTHKKELKKTGIQKANVAVRNFPMSVAQIRKKIKIHSGGDDYLFFTQNQHGKKMLIWCKKH